MCCTQAKLALPRGRDAVLPPLVVPKPLAAPVRDVEGRIGEDVVGLQVGMAIVAEAVAVGNLVVVDAPDSQIHLGQFPGGVVGLLPPDEDIVSGLPSVAVAGGVGIDELHRLDEHAGGTAAWVVDAALVGLQHLHQELDDTTRGVELAALLSFGAGELGEEVLVHPAQHVFGAGFRVTNLDVGDQVNELA